MFEFGIHLLKYILQKFQTIPYKRGGNKDFVSMSEPDQFTIIFWIVLFCSGKGVGSNLTDAKLSNWLFCKNPLPTPLIERLFLNESTVATEIKSPRFILIIVICDIFFFLIGCLELRIELIHNRLQSFFKRHVFHELPRI